MQHYLTGEQGAGAVREVKRYQLDIVGLTSTNSSGLVKQTPYMELPQVRHRARVGILTSPQLSAEFTQENVTSMQLSHWGTVVCAYVLHSSEYGTFWSRWMVTWKGYHLETSYFC